MYQEVLIFWYEKSYIVVISNLATSIIEKFLDVEVNLKCYLHQIRRQVSNIKQLKDGTFRDHWYEMKPLESREQFSTFQVSSIGTWNKELWKHIQLYLLKTKLPIFIKFQYCISNQLIK